MSTDDEIPPGRAAQKHINLTFWGNGDHVAAYARRELLPVEVVILTRYREALAGRVLEVGCGAGRILGYLIALGGEVHGVDISEAMVAYCRRTYPRADVRVGDLADLGSSVGGRFTGIFAADNVLDVFDDGERRRVLLQLRALLAPGGLLIFSSHNLAIAGDRSTPVSWIRRVALTPPRVALSAVTRLPRRARNRRRLAPLVHRASDHAVLNDEAHDYGLLHYYIRRDDQERQLQELGYRLLECLDVDGTTVAPGAPGAGAALYYVAQPG